MPSSLPTDPALTKAVDTFGLGTYDSQSDEEPHGEDDEHREPAGTSLPDGGPTDGFNLEFYLSYPQEEIQKAKHALSLPGDSDRPPPTPRPADRTLDSLAGPPSDVRISDSELPSDSDNPPARTDDYDPMFIGQEEKDSKIWDSADMWTDEDSGAYVTQETPLDSLPTAPENEVDMDDFLGALGNAWQGFVVEDQAVPHGFPSPDFEEEADYFRGDPNDPSYGELQPFGQTSSDRTMTTRSMRTATDITLVRELTKGFLKDYGRKNIVRRHVLAYLQKKALPQYLASDIVRCIKHDHNLVIPDVMDTFPVSEETSPEVRKASSYHDRLIELGVENGHDPRVSSMFRKCAAGVANSIVALRKLEGRNG